MIDSFYPRKSTYRPTLFKKAINSHFQGKAPSVSAGKVEDKNHGFHVAGIIACDHQGEKEDLTIGVAPLAQFEMLSTNDVNLADDSFKDDEASETQWTVERMAELITKLFHEKEIEIRGYHPIRLADYNNNPIVASNASILNFSGAPGSSDSASLTTFNGLEGLPVFLCGIQAGKLWVMAAGNDGLNLSTTNRYRFLKALAFCPETTSQMLIVTNLMEDGLTLNPDSNIPERDMEMQRRTLSALGTNIKSTAFQENSTDQEYVTMSGTSMAAPYISGIAAIILSNFPKLTASQLSECLLKGATPIIVKEDGTAVALDITVDELEKERDKALSLSKSQGSLRLLIAGVEMTLEDLDRGRQIYGIGRVNLEGAILRAKEIH